MPLIKRGALALGKGALKTGLDVAGDVLSGQSIKSSAKRRLKETGKDMISKVLGSSTHGTPDIRLVHRTIKRKPTRKFGQCRQETETTEDASRRHIRQLDNHGLRPSIVL